MSESSLSNLSENVNTFFESTSKPAPQPSEERVNRYKTYLPNLANDFFLSGRQKRILRELFRHINQTLYIEQNDSIVWPGAKRITELIGTQKNNVYADLKILREEGYISKTTIGDRKSKNRHKSVQPYSINLEKVEVNMPAKIIQFPTTEISEPAPHPRPHPRPHSRPHSRPHPRPHSRPHPYIRNEGEEKQQRNAEKKEKRGKDNSLPALLIELSVEEQEFHDKVLEAFNTIYGTHWNDCHEVKVKIKEGKPPWQFKEILERTKDMKYSNFYGQLVSPTLLFRDDKWDKYLNLVKVSLTKQEESEAFYDRMRIKTELSRAQEQPVETKVVNEEECKKATEAHNEAMDIHDEVIVYINMVSGKGYPKHGFVSEELLYLIKDLHVSKDDLLKIVDNSMYLLKTPESWAKFNPRDLFNNDRWQDHLNNKHEEPQPVALDEEQKPVTASRRKHVHLDEEQKHEAS